MIEIKSEGLGSSDYWTNSLEEGDGSSSRFSTFRNFGEYFNYLLWESPKVFQDGVQASLDLLQADIERRKLQLDPVYKDDDIPRGDGSDLTIVPGFMGNGFWYSLPRENFSKLGYQTEVYHPRYGLHIGPTEKEYNPLTDELMRKAEKSGKKGHVVAHSKGGHVALTAAIFRTKDFTECVDQLILVGSPIPDKVNFQIGVGYLAMQALFRGNDFRLTSLANDEEALSRLKGLRVTSLKIKNDPAISGLHPGEGQVIEVESSHSGALNERGNIRFIARTLARPAEPSVNGDENFSVSSQKRAA